MSTKTESIGVPTVKGMKSAFGDFLVGCGGGLAWALASAFLGSGLIGSLIAPVLAGSVVKGPRGTALATIAGFMLFAGALGGGGGGVSATSGGGETI